MTTIVVHRVTALPGVLEASALYIVRSATAPFAELYFTSADGADVRRLLNKADMDAAIAAASIGGGGAATEAAKLTNARLINGVAFDGTANITINAEDATARIAVTEKGAANGVATLDGTGKVPTSQLPSYVDDVVEFADLAALPGTGEAGKIYVTADNNKTYRWSGSVYVEVGSGTGTADNAVKLLTPRAISATGDAAWSVNFDGSADATAAITLANVVAAGEKMVPTVNAKGLVTGSRALVAADIPTLDFNKVTSAASLNLATSEW